MTKKLSKQQDTAFNQVQDNHLDHEHEHGHDCGCSHNAKTIVNHSPKIGRNDPCSCGSGKKYKKCCLSYS
jgi:uncharacterized protein YecA (UPF0149 family)